MMIPIAPPLCLLCKRFRLDVPYPTPGVCDAFPDGIPSSMMERLGDHREPVRGDHGIRFEPREDVTPADVAEWARARRSR